VSIWQAVVTASRGVHGGWIFPACGIGGRGKSRKGPSCRSPTSRSGSCKSQSVFAVSYMYNAHKIILHSCCLLVYLISFVFFLGSFISTF